MKRAVQIAVSVVLLILISLAAVVAWNWAPDRPVADLKPRWALPPSQFVAVGDLRVHMRDEGPRDDPAPIVLLHGTADSLFTWVRQPLGVAIAEQTAPPVGVALAPQQPQQFGISAAWPNPVTAAAGSAQWRITALHPLQAGEVRICNSLGQTVRSWPLAAAGAGDHLLTWDLRDGRGITVAPGIYYLQVRLEGAALTRMVQVLR